VAGTLQDIRLFVAAYEERSITAAAERENATQSGVSQHVRKLEDQLGVALFKRDKGRISPTPAGHAYYLQCVEILRSHQRATQVVSSFAGGIHGRLVVGLIPTLTQCLLAPVLTRFMAAHPNVSIHIVEGFSGTLTRMVQAGELDFAIVPEPLNKLGLKSRLFLRTFEVLISRRHAQRRHLAPVSPADLGPLKLVMPGQANARRQALDSYCASNGVVVEQIVEMDAMLATLDLIAQSDWRTILPAILIDPDAAAGRHTVNPLVGPALDIELQVVEPNRKSMSQEAETFLEALDTEGRRLAARWREVLAGLPA
jgi:LysR family nitrogen assimilation transcriptional regulator